MAKKKTKCEYCGNSFVDISRHKCKAKPAGAKSTTDKVSKKAGSNKTNNSKSSGSKVTKKSSAKSSKKATKKASKKATKKASKKPSKSSSSKGNSTTEVRSKKSVAKKSAGKKSAGKKSVAKKSAAKKSSGKASEISAQKNKKVSKSKKSSPNKPPKNSSHVESKSTENRTPKKRINYSEIDKKVLTIIQQNGKIYSDSLSELIPEINYKYIEKSLKRLESKKKIQLSSDIVGGIRKILIRFIEEYEIKDKSSIIEKEALCWETLNDCPCFLCPDIKKCNLGQNEKNPITCPDIIEWMQHSINNKKYVSPFKENLDIEKLKKGK